MMKKILFFICSLVLVFFLVSCNQNDEQHKIYKLAREAGYTGTYDDWLNSIKGQDGISIIYAEVNEDGYLVIKLSNNELLTVGKVTGSDGKDGLNGQDGLSIKSTEVNEDGYLVIKLSNDEILTVGKVAGSDGKDGENGQDGISIKSAEVNEDGYLIIKLSNDEILTAGKVVGSDGKNGEDGKDGQNGISIKSAEVNEDGYLIIKLSNDETLTAGKVLGNDGIGIENVKLTSEGDLIINLGSTELNLGNIKGDKGEDGKSIENVTLSSEGDLIVTLGDKEINLGNIKGEEGGIGKDGMSAYEIYLEYFPDYNKNEKEWLEDLINGELGKNNKHIVTFNYDNGIENVDTYVEHSYKIGKPEEPIKEGYKFIGWYYGEYLWNFDLYPVLDDMELIAKYEKYYKINDIKESADDISYRFKATVVAKYDSNIILEDETGNITLNIDKYKVGDELDIIVTSDLTVLSVEHIGESQLIRNPISVNSNNYTILSKVDSGYASKCVKVTGTLNEMGSVSYLMALRTEYITTIACKGSNEVTISEMSKYKNNTVTLVGYFIENFFIVVEIN